MKERCTNESDFLIESLSAACLYGFISESWEKALTGYSGTRYPSNNQRMIEFMYFIDWLSSA